jgi:hypothetical protein
VKAATVSRATSATAAAASWASPTARGQEEQLNALGLIVNTIVLYTTIYTQRAIDHIAARTGSEPRDEDIERLSPLGSDHITLIGRYRVLLPAPLQDRSAYRALHTAEDAAAALPGFPNATSRRPKQREPGLFCALAGRPAHQQPAPQPVTPNVWVIEVLGSAGTSP